MSYVKEHKHLVKAFPKELHNEAKSIAKKLKKVEVWDEPYVVRLYEQDVLIPRRIIFKQPLSPNGTSQLELCLRTRSTDGSEREQALKLLTKTRPPLWALPFILLSLGDYVIQVSAVTTSNKELEY